MGTTRIRARRWGWCVAASLLLAACGAPPAEQDNAAAPAPESAGAPPQALPADQSTAAPAAGAPAAKTASAPARRCGWLHNPTPGNWWLADRDGEWILGTQGGRSAEGMDEMPDMSALEWQETNGHYGYGCACLTVTADPETREVIRFADPEAKPLAACRADTALPDPGP
ncbi:MAG: DUF4087 domain-containing protein [Allosphingosinicella sp.]